MRELLSFIFAGILPILYIGSSKDFFFVRLRRYTGVIAIGSAALGAAMLTLDWEQRLSYAMFAPLGHFAVIVAVDEAFKSSYGRYPAPMYSHPHPPKDRVVDGLVMFVGVMGCLAVTATTLYFVRKAVDL